MTGALLDLLATPAPIPRPLFMDCLRDVGADPLGAYGRVLRRSAHFGPPTGPPPPRRSAARTADAPPPPGADVHPRYRRMLAGLPSVEADARRSSLLVIDHHLQGMQGSQLCQTIKEDESLGFVPVIGPLARFMAVVLSLIGLWMGVAAAHDLKGWRTILLPVIYILTAIIAVVFLLSCSSSIWC